MSKLIEKLTVEANNQTGNEFDLNHKPLDAFLEKFAELIVQECCDVLQNEDIRYSGYGYNQGFLHKKIKEHFGVE